MDPILKYLIYGLVTLSGIISFYSVWKAQSKDMVKFLVWFSCSLVLILLMLSIISNKFVISFILAIVISLLAIHER